MPTTLRVLRQNRLLESLPEDLSLRIAEDLTEVQLVQKTILFEHQDLITEVYFPTTCLISEVVDLNSGNTVEALTVGKDGFADSAAFLGKSRSTLKGMVQIGGDALSISFDDFTRYLAEPEFRAVLGSYVEQAIALLAQSSACLAFHPTEQRLARWLLEVQDRTDKDELGLTQEFLAQMLGVQRPTATLAVRMLVESGLIFHRRGSISLVDRDGLMMVACECFRALRSAD